MATTTKAPPKRRNWWWPPRWARPATSSRWKTFVPVTDAALVIGGGIGGISAALELANMGHKTYLVKRPYRRRHGPAGQNLSHQRLFGLHPYLMMVEAFNHPNIETLTYPRPTTSKASAT